MYLTDQILCGSNCIDSFYLVNLYRPIHLYSKKDGPNELELPESYSSFSKQLGMLPMLE